MPSEVRLERFEIRRGSGGAGRYPGGDGVVRALKFLEQRQVSILSERRNFAPYGAQGGRPGKSGENLLIRADGAKETLPGKISLAVEANETVVIKTPGGGGWGKPDG